MIADIATTIIGTGRRQREPDDSPDSSAGSLSICFVALSQNVSTVTRSFCRFCSVWVVVALQIHQRFGMAAEGSISSRSTRPAKSSMRRSPFPCSRRSLKRLAAPFGSRAAGILDAPPLSLGSVQEQPTVSSAIRRASRFDSDRHSVGSGFVIVLV